MSEQEKVTQDALTAAANHVVAGLELPASVLPRKADPRPTPRWITAVLDQLDDHGLPPR